MLAEQLTLIDAVCLPRFQHIDRISFALQELLKAVRPHECLTMGGNANHRRGVQSQRALSTVDKTIEQFNAVVKRVIGTVLDERNDQMRARVIEKWIDVAHECRQLKNFSSLTAILNALLSGCIYRLKNAWSFVDSHHGAILNCLKDVSGSSADRQQARAILDRVKIKRIFEIIITFLSLLAIRRDSFNITRIQCKFSSTIEFPYQYPLSPPFRKVQRSISIQLYPLMEHWDEKFE